MYFFTWLFLKKWFNSKLDNHTWLMLVVTITSALGIIFSILLYFISDKATEKLTVLTVKNTFITNFHTNDVALFFSTNPLLIDQEIKDRFAKDSWYSYLLAFYYPESINNNELVKVKNLDDYKNNVPVKGYDILNERLQRVVKQSNDWSSWSQFIFMVLIISQIINILSATRLMYLDHTIKNDN